jgi:hypothetical protein
MPLSQAAAEAVAGYVFPDKPVAYNKKDAILYALGAPDEPLTVEPVVPLLGSVQTMVCSIARLSTQAE